MEISNWIVTSAWPYAHDVPHLGNLIQLLSADIFTRFLRLKGENVILVSGSDEHGTPIEVKAIKAGKDPKDLTDEVHKKITSVLKGFNIKFDNYTRTHSRTHIKFVQDFYRKIYKNGYIFEKEEAVLYCEKDKLYLPDRFVEGICPYCDYKSARGDQCENCGKLLTPTELINAYCVVCGTPPIVKSTRHFYFKLPEFERKLHRLIMASDTLTENAKKFSLNMIREGLVDRSITRSNKWGIPAPFPGSEELTIYVWFEAVLGYVSAVKEYFEKELGDPDKWREWWFNSDTNIAFFIGKDNIPFHTIIFPSLLMATHDPYSLRFYIGATEYLNFEGMKFSKTHKIGIWGDEALELLPADYWRYTLTHLRPETKDTNFTWRSLEHAVNDELNNEFGNLVHRLLTLIKKNFWGTINRKNPVTDAQKEIYDIINEVSNRVEKIYFETRFQRVLPEVMKLIKKANALINLERPWETADSDREMAEATLYTVYMTVKAASIMLYPIIPESSLKILDYLGLDHRKVSWEGIFNYEDKVIISREFKPVFNRIDVNKLKLKLDRLRGVKVAEVDLDYLSKIDIKVGKIEKAERKVGTKKILRLMVNLGDRKIKILAGLAQFYKPEELIGKNIVVITNMKPKKIMDESSEGMLLAAIDKKGKVRLLVTDGDIEPGAKVG